MTCTLTAVTPSNRPAHSSFGWSTLLSLTTSLNITLVCLCAGFLVYYIAGVNAMASSEYNVSAVRAKIIKLTEAQNLLTAEKSATENPVAATAFAQAQHMVEAKDIVYVFENNNVALQK